MNDYSDNTNPKPCYGCGQDGAMPFSQTGTNVNPDYSAFPFSGNTATPAYGVTPPAYGTSASAFGATVSAGSQNFVPALSQQQAQQQQGRSLSESDLAPITALNPPMPVTTQSLQYINGFLRTQIGKKVTIEFLIGTNTLLDKSGLLLGIGANFLLLRESETDDLLVCDFFSVKFVRIYY